MSGPAGRRALGAIAARAPITPHARRAGRLATVAALALLLSVGWLGESAAKPPLGERGWAPGSLPWTLGPAAVTGMLAAAYLLGAAGLWLGLRDRGGWPGWAIAAVAAGALLAMPFGSADHTNYAAYGRIALQGGDPYVESPIAWAGGDDPVTSGVQPPWQETPSIYGPLSTVLQVFAAWAGGDSLRQVVWMWQLLIVGAWLATRWLLRRLFPDASGRVDVLWTMNPFVIGAGVLGAHVDTLATPLMVGALLLARRPGRPWALAAGTLGGLALSVKVTAGVILVAIALGWLIERRRAATRVLTLAAGAALAAVPLHLWAGARAYDQLGRSRRSISLATPWRKIYEWFGGQLPDATWRSLLFVLAGLTCLALAWLAWRVLCTQACEVDTPVMLALALSIGYAAGAPYVLPWYDQLVWALLPAVAAAGLLERVWIVRSLILALAYVPGRVVGMTPGVEEVTLIWRRDMAPLAAVLVWIALVVASRSACRPASVTPRRPARSPRQPPAPRR